MIRWLRNLWCRWFGHRWEVVTLSWEESVKRMGPIILLIGDGFTTRRCRRCGLIEGKMEL